MTPKTPKRPAKAKKPALRHPVPPGLGKAGTALWTRIVADLDEGWRFDERELHILAESCLTADTLAKLEEAIDADGVTTTGSRGQVVVNPAITESRQARALILRLLSSLELTDPADKAASGTPHQARARRAAEVRWNRDKRRSIADG